MRSLLRITTRAAIVESIMTRFANIRMASAVMVALAGTPAAAAQLKGNFDVADANHDGRVTLQEYEAYATSRLMAANGRMAQKFRQLSPQEQAARLQQRFAKMDSAHKGYLDRNDWSGS
jgi:Ca2+-binding EF-hand superfamily protein